jgi:hypothetical protein
LTQCGITQETADAGEDLEVLGDVDGDQEEKETDGTVIDGAIGDADGMAADDDDGVFNQPGEGGAGVRQRDAIAYACAVQFFAFEQGAEQGLASFGAVRQFGDGSDEFDQDFGAIAAGEAELDGGGGEEVTDAETV